MKKDTNERIRFATYFAKVTIDKKARYRWSEYLKSLKTLQADTMRIEEQLIAARKAGDIQHAKELESEFSNLRRQMAPSPKDNEYITSQKAEDYLILGNDLYSKSNNEESLNNYDEAIKLNPDSDEVWVSKGVVLEDMNRYEDALKAYEKAIELNNSNADAWIGKGVTLCHLNSYDKAIEANNKAIELKPDLAKGWYNLACIYSIKGKKEDALVKLKEAIKLDEYNKVMAQRDDDFKNIREDKKFQDLLNNM